MKIKIYPIGIVFFLCILSAIILCLLKMYVWIDIGWDIIILAEGLVISLVIGGFNMFKSFISIEIAKEANEIAKDTQRKVLIAKFRGPEMRKTKRILWDFKKIPGVNFIEEYGKLLGIIPKDKYDTINFSEKEKYATRIDEARGDYAYFFLDLYDIREDVDGDFFKKYFKPGDIKLLSDIVAPMEQLKTQHDNTFFDKKEAFDYFGELFKKVKK